MTYFILIRKNKFKKIKKNKFKIKILFNLKILLTTYFFIISKFYNYINYKM